MKMKRKDKKEACRKWEEVWKGKEKKLEGCRKMEEVWKGKEIGRL